MDNEKFNKDFAEAAAKEVERLGQLSPEQMLQHIAELSVSIVECFRVIGVVAEACNMLTTEIDQLKEGMRQLQKAKRMPIPSINGEA